MTTKRLIDVDITDRTEGWTPVWSAGGNTHVYANIAGVGAAAFRGCKAYHSTTQTVNTGTQATMLLDSDEIDTDAFHFTSAANLTGTVTKAAASPNIVGAGTAFTTELSVNQVISIPGTAVEIGVVKTITDDTNLELWQTMANSASGQTATRRNEYFATPAGFTGYVRLWGGTFWGGYTGTTNSWLAIQKNGAHVRGGITDDPFHVAHYAEHTPVTVACSPGDYFSLYANNGSSANEALGSAGVDGATWFALDFAAA